MTKAFAASKLWSMAGLPTCINGRDSGARAIVSHKSLLALLGNPLNYSKKMGLGSSDGFANTVSDAPESFSGRDKAKTLSASRRM